MQTDQFNSFSPDSGSSEGFLLLIKEVLSAMVGSLGAVSGGCRFGCCFDCCKGGALCHCWSAVGVGALRTAVSKTQLTTQKRTN